MQHTTNHLCRCIIPWWLILFFWPTALETHRSIALVLVAKFELQIKTIRWKDNKVNREWTQLSTSTKTIQFDNNIPISIQSNLVHCVDSFVFFTIEENSQCFDKWKPPERGARIYIMLKEMALLSLCWDDAKLANPTYTSRFGLKMVDDLFRMYKRKRKIEWRKWSNAFGFILFLVLLFEPS